MALTGGYTETEQHETGQSAAVNEKHVLEVIAGGSFAEMAGGIGAVILAIVGLAGIVPNLLAAIAAISIGAAILLEGLAVSTEYTRLLHGVADNEEHVAELTGGMGGEFFAGSAGVVLGILAILNVAPLVLLPIAAIVLGVGVALSSGTKTRLNAFKIERDKNTLFQRVARDMVATAVGADLLVGLTAAILGILAILGISPLILTLVAMLIMGGTTVIGGSAQGGRMINLARTTGRTR